MLSSISESPAADAGAYQPPPPPPPPPPPEKPPPPLPELEDGLTDADETPELIELESDRFML